MSETAMKQWSHVSKKLMGMFLLAMSRHPHVFISPLQHYEAAAAAQDDAPAEERLDTVTIFPFSVCAVLALTTQRQLFLPSG